MEGGVGIAPRRKRLSRKFDSTIIEYWLNQENRRLFNISEWLPLLRQFEALGVDTGCFQLRDRWLKKIDPRMEDAYSVQIKSREELGYNDALEERHLFRILDQRLLLFKTAVAKKRAAENSFNEPEPVASGDAKVKAKRVRKKKLPAQPRKLKTMRVMELMFKLAKQFSQLQKFLRKARSDYFELYKEKIDPRTIKNWISKLNAQSVCQYYNELQRHTTLEERDRVALIKILGI